MRNRPSRKYKLPKYNKVDLGEQQYRGHYNPPKQDVEKQSQTNLVKLEQNSKVHWGNMLKVIKSFLHQAKNLVLSKKIQVTIMSLGIISIGWHTFNNFFSLKEILIQSSNTTHHLNTLSATVRNKNLLWLNLEDYKMKLLKSNFILKDINLIKELPDKIFIYPTWREPVAIMRTDVGDFILDETGMILSRERESKLVLPKLEYYQKLNYFTYQAGSNPFTPEVVMGLYLAHSAQTSNIIIDKIIVKSPHEITLMTGQIAYIFASDKDLYVQEYQFLRVVKQYEIEGKQYVQIDFRYDKPIIKRW